MSNFTSNQISWNINYNNLIHCAINIIKYHFIAILVLSSCYLNSQENNPDYLFIKSLSALRQSLLESSGHKLEHIDSLRNKWIKIELDSNKIDFLLYNISYAVAVHELNLKQIKRRCKSENFSKELIEKINSSDIELLGSTYELFELFQSNLLEFKNPYKLVIDTIFKQEIKFLDIQESDLVADIGSGTGTQILITAMNYPKNNFTLNEIDRVLCNYLEKKIFKNKELLFLENRSIEIVKGSNKNINLNYKVDKIIARNSLHHFKKKNAMIFSIENNLKNNGQFIIIEDLKSNQLSNDDCNEKMEYDKIIELIEMSNFKITEELNKNNTLYLKCKRK